MGNFVKKWNDTSLILRIVVGLVIGIILALAVPQATVISIFGTVFVGALKAIAPILVFVLVMSSLSQATDGIGKRFRTVIGLYMLSTLLAAVVAVFASFLFPVTLKLAESTTDTVPPSGIGEVFTNLLNNIVSNPVDALTNANYVGILTWSIILGLALKKLAKPYSEDEDDFDEFDDDVRPSRASRSAAAPAPARDSFDTSYDDISTSTRRTPGGSKVVNIHTTAQMQVVLVKPDRFDSVSDIADHLRSKKAVIVNMENVDKAMARRVVDFLSGCAYAVDGKVKKVAQSTYLFCPHNMDVVGDLENLQSEVESYI